MSAPDVMKQHDGETYDPARDMDRLSSLRERVLSYMLRHDWVTLEDLVKACGGTTASASAKMRDLRKLKHGGWSVQRRHVHAGLFEYRLQSAQLVLAECAERSTAVAEQVTEAFGMLIDALAKGEK